MPKFILYQAGLASITKDELKTIVICHVTAENAWVYATKVGHVNTARATPFPSKKYLHWKVHVVVRLTFISNCQICKLRKIFIYLKKNWR